MKQFFINFFANIAALLFVFGGPLLLLFILVMASVSFSSSGNHIISIERGSILVLDMSMNVTDSPEHASSTDALRSALGQDQSTSMTLRSLVRALNKASHDTRIKGVLLTGSFEPADYGTGYASLKELRDAIVAFQSTPDHKPVWAYLGSPTTRDYYVASAASTIYLNPYGEMEMPGLAVVKTYYAQAAQKYGVDVQVTRVGKYKSAVEPYILDKMSDADREETTKLLGDLWDEFIGAVSVSRKIDPAQVQQLVDTEGFIKPESALAAHLVDQLAYFGDVLTELGKVAPSSDFATVPLPFKQVALSDYIEPTTHTPHLIGDTGSGDLVAVLYCEGEIVDGDGDTTNIGGDRFAAQLRELRRNDDVKAVVLRVNSPGGSAFASEVIQREVIALKAKKPVIISMGNYAASGGYWISTYGDRIFAEPNTITGSIGVFGMFVDIQKLSNDFGVTYDTAKTGNYADFDTISRPKTPQELALAQARVDDLYQKFLTKVSASRGIPIDSVALIAQGRVWSGREALNLKLVDELGGLPQAITYAASKAKLGSRYHVKEYPETLDFAQELALLLSGQTTPVAKVATDPLTRQFLKIKADLKSLQDFNDPQGIYARLPLGLQVQ